MAKALITVVETAAFKVAAKGALTSEETSGLIDDLAANPESGVVIVGGSGIRKVRVSAKGKGKSGGARVIYYYYDNSIPIFLLTVFAKNEKDNLSDAEKAALAKVARAIKETYNG